MWEELEEAIKGVEEASDYEKAVKRFALDVLNKCKNAEGLELACCLKLLMEIGIQILYMKRFKPEARMDVLKRRSERGVAFNMSMLERSGLPGPYKKRILRTYLKIASYVHPSVEALQGQLPGDLASKAIEVLVMIYSSSR